MNPNDIEQEEEEGPPHVDRLAWVYPPAVLALEGVLLHGYLLRSLCFNLGRYPPQNAFILLVFLLIKLLDFYLVNHE